MAVSSRTATLVVVLNVNAAAWTALEKQSSGRSSGTMDIAPQLQKLEQQTLSTTPGHPMSAGSSKVPLALTFEFCWRAVVGFFLAVVVGWGRGALLVIHSSNR